MKGLWVCPKTRASAFPTPKKRSLTLLAQEVSMIKEAENLESWRLNKMVNYECIWCGAQLTQEQVEIFVEIKCPQCGSRILRNVRPPIARHVLAR